MREDRVDDNPGRCPLDAPLYAPFTPPFAFTD
jgi:hypothetical protein